MNQMNSKNKIYIIAEAGVNHNGSLEMALALIDAAATAGADAVKFQTFNAEKVISKFAAKAPYQVKNTNGLESQYEMVKKFELDQQAHKYLLDYCSSKGIEFLSSPFDEESLNFLVKEMHVSRIKIASGEITNAPLLLSAAQKSKPLIVSTGMCSLGEIEMALGLIAFGFMNRKERPSIHAFQAAYYSDEGQRLLKENVILLHCTTEYPAPYEDVNLRAMDTIAQAFNLEVGYSDHTRGIAIPIAAAARGAKIIEKHFTLDRKLPGPDHQASLEPDELVMMVRSVREVEEALGSAIKKPACIELKNQKVARKSLTAASPINKGEKFTEENLECKRPGTGVPPFHYWSYLGREAHKNFKADEMIE